MEVGNIEKAATFINFLQLSYKNTKLPFLWQCFLNIFMRQTLTDKFCRLHKNMNCVFLLKIFCAETSEENICDKAFFLKNKIKFGTGEWVHFLVKLRWEVAIKLSRTNTNDYYYYLLLTLF